MVVRDFLPVGTTPSPFYRYYLFLIMVDRTPETALKREALAEAFMCQVPSKDEAESIPVPQEQLAIFYAPVNTRDVAPLGSSRSGSDLLEIYSYAVARDMMQDLRSNPDIEVGEGKIGILATPFSSPSTSQDEFIDLSEVPPRQIFELVRQLRHSIEGTYEVREVDVTLSVDPESGAPLETERMRVPVVDPLPRASFATAIRRVFASLGSLVVAGSNADEFACT